MIDHKTILKAVAEDTLARIARMDAEIARFQNDKRFMNKYLKLKELLRDRDREAACYVVGVLEMRKHDETL